jgi:hypothetical protein
LSAIEVPKFLRILQSGKTHIENKQKNKKERAKRDRKNTRNEQSAAA